MDPIAPTGLQDDFSASGRIREQKATGINRSRLTPLASAASAQQ
ncbi:MAG: hypothetical protein PUC83_11030 [Fibrobacter sp.]|nr:hypothetical protein [Fibrobacter sp.]